jgi:HEAT repeat protein
MRSMKEIVLRGKIGFVLAAVATFALAMPAHAQDQSQGQGQSQGQSQSQDQSQGKDKSKGQGASSKEKVKDKSGDSAYGGVSGGVKDGVSGGVGFGKSFGQGIGADGWSGYLDDALAYAAEAKALANTSGQWKELANDLGYNVEFDMRTDLKFDTDYMVGLDGLKSSIFGQQDDGGRDKDRKKDADRRDADRESSLYSQGSSALDQGKWQMAEDKFDQVAEMKMKRADAGLFWKAYAQNKLGHRTEALATLSAMEKQYPQSRWLDDAKKLEVEVKQLSGQPVSPDDESNCELKLLALNGLQQADPAKAVPLLEKMIHNTDCVKIRSQAFFVLAQSNSPEARDLITKMAKGEGVNPLVQEKAIQALGMYRADSGREILGQIYASSNDTDVKRAILRALMMSGDKARIFAAAKSEKDTDLRIEAIRQLGMMNDRDDIWQLYQTETSVDVKKQILTSIFQSGDVDRVSQLAVNEKDPSLKMTAISYLGMMDRRNASKGEDTLLQIYAADSNPEVRKKIIGALFVSNDAKALVTLAKKETDPEMKKKIVSELSVMKSPDATAYLLELLNK